MWPSSRFTDLVGIEYPIVQSPMIGPKPELARHVSAAGGLGSLGCASMTPDQVRAEVAALRAFTDKPFNLNFFVHRPAPADPARDAAWREELKPYYAELGLNPEALIAVTNRAPFDAAMCAVVEEVRPKVVSFHFGLPAPELMARVKAAGAVVLASATSVAEARWLEENGADAIIAQGSEAGGHRGMFLNLDPAFQVGTFALVPQVADAVSVPVIAAGAVADGRGIAAAFALGADAVQIGTAYLLTPEAGISAVHRAALKGAPDDATTLTNVFTGRPARGILNRLMREHGPIKADAPAFPTAAPPLGPLKAAAEAKGSGDFSALWSGQAGRLAREIGAGELTRTLAKDALEVMGRLKG
ncbi:nitronate monooxygenase family protein [Aquabacter sp. CN5-332]|uniref:NAD(P)H-dependent flavin oxidoreductase n=1 Tax=Aquabacter sp. CN5-332 TaxID=3156608 RepID=UPI0032B53EFD